MVPPPFLLVPDLRVPGVRPANEHIACQKRRQRTMMSLLDKGSGVYLEIMTGNVIDRTTPSGPNEGPAGRPPMATRNLPLATRRKSKPGLVARPSGRH